MAELAEHPAEEPLDPIADAGGLALAIAHHVECPDALGDDPVPDLARLRNPGM